MLLGARLEDKVDKVKDIGRDTTEENMNSRK